MAASAGRAIRAAVPGDEALVLGFVGEPAAYERLAHAVTATEPDVGRALFGEPRRAEVPLAYADGAPVGFALSFQILSTFVGRPFTSETASCGRRRGDAGTGPRRCAALPASRATGAADAWSGRCSTATAPPSTLTLRRGARPLKERTIYRLDGAALVAPAEGDAGPGEARSTAVAS